MWYTCKKCRHDEARGCLPTVSCGMLLSVYVGIAGAVVLVVIDLLFPRGLGWWWLLGGPVLVVLSLFGGMLVHLLCQLLEWLLFCLRRCPKCRARAWSWGYTRGFGL